MKNPPLLILAFIFFVVGALFCMNDVIFPYVKEYYHLTYFQTSLIQWTFYIVYLPFPFLISKLVNHYGYKLAIIYAICVTVLGSLIFYPAFLLSSYAILLGSIFIISLGITVLNVAANPYAALLGSPENSELRINFVQVFSRIGYAVTPILGNYLVKPSSAAQSPTIYLPYMTLALCFLIALILMFAVQMPALKPEIKENTSFKTVMNSLKKYPHLMWGSFAMFFYVGVEACTASYFISYVTANFESINLDKASEYLTWYNVLAGLGGFLGIYLLKFIKGATLIAVFGSILIMLYACVSFQTINQVWVLILVGLFIAPMFPTIYGLSIAKLGDFTIHGAALVSLAIVGGAIFPPLQGLVADQFGVAFSYIVPAICFVFILIYSLFFSTPKEMSAS